MCLELLLFLDYPTIMGFEPFVNQRLLPPTFPRYTVIQNCNTALDYVSSLLQRLETSTMILAANNVQEVNVSIVGVQLVYLKRRVLV